MQSILELFKLEVELNFISPKITRLQESLIKQLNQYWDYLSQKFNYLSTLFQQKCKITQESLIQQLNQYWDYQLSQKLIIHQLWKLFQQKCKIAQESLIQQLNQYWDYLSLEVIGVIIHQLLLCFSKSARLHRSRLYSNSVNTGTI